MDATRSPLSESVPSLVAGPATGEQPSLQTLLELLQGLDSVVWIADWKRRQPLYVNAAYERVWGRSASRLLQHPEDWLEGIHPEDRARVAALAFDEATRGRFASVFRVQRPDGSERLVQARGFAIPDATGAAYRASGIAEDITFAGTRQPGSLGCTRAQALSAAAHLEERHETLRALVADCIRNDVSQQLARLRIDLALQQRELPNGPREASIGMASTVERLLDSLAILARRLVPPELGELDVAAAVEALARQCAQRRNWSLRLDLSPLTPAHAGHGTRLFRIVEELLQRIEHDPTARTVELSLREDRARLHLRIATDATRVDWPRDEPGDEPRDADWLLLRGARLRRDPVAAGQSITLTLPLDESLGR